MSNRSRLRRGVRRLRVLYDYLDKTLDQGELERRSGSKISCSKGCAACCRLPVSATIAEALLIFEALEKTGDKLLLQSVMKEANAQADLVMAGGITKESWWAKQVACPLLGPSTNLCRAYDLRPEACRMHFVVSPMENCQPGAVDGNTLQLNFSETSKRQWMAEIMATNEELGVNSSPMPMGLALSLAAMLWHLGPDELRRRMKGSPLADTVSTVAFFTQMFHREELHALLQRHATGVRADEPAASASSTEGLDQDSRT